MPYHIFINRESGNDNISVFYDEPTFVVIANKDDLPAIQLVKSIILCKILYNVLPVSH
ncbi:hypothetical protein EB20_02718 [Enterococcus hirae]|nr:hypothetical protein EB20_02718 [Enterococcus hirae]RBT46711.1 hypothetical protein EB10_02863 [Enterococcus hirae]RBT57582.1 hypothetical protein EB39_02834 [Enterococcus hirae]